MSYYLRKKVKISLDLNKTEKALKYERIEFSIIFMKMFLEMKCFWKKIIYDYFMS